jgi:7-cyano-7-deazaguanine synthase
VNMQKKIFEERKESVLLYSGGMDSYALNMIYKPEVLLYLDAASGYSVEEKKRLPSKTTIFPFSLESIQRPDKIIPCRNLLFCSIASNFGSQIFLGATAGDRVRDKDQEFASQTSKLLSYIWQPDHWTTGKTIEILLPFKHLTKRQIVALVISKGLDAQELAEQSFSCYSNKSQECGKCKPCFRKWVAFILNGIRLKMDARRYIEKEILPQIKSGRYNRKEEELEILEALNVDY